MGTLRVNLDQRVSTAPRYKASTVRDYFRNSSLKWWDPRDLHYTEQTRKIREWLKELSPKSVLELGAGFGRITELLDKLPEVDLTIVDINKKALNVLRKKFFDRNVVEEDVSDFHYEESKYDLVVAAELLVHVPNIEDLIQKIHGSLTEEGTLITSITPDNWYEANWKRIPTTHRGINQREFENFVSEYFDIVKTNKSKNGQLVTYLLRKK